MLVAALSVKTFLAPNFVPTPVFLLLLASAQHVPKVGRIPPSLLKFFVGVGTLPACSGGWDEGSTPHRSLPLLHSRVPIRVLRFLRPLPSSSEAASLLPLERPGWGFSWIKSPSSSSKTALWSLSKQHPKRRGGGGTSELFQLSQPLRVVSGPASCTHGLG